MSRLITSDKIISNLRFTISIRTYFSDLIPSYSRFSVNGLLSTPSDLLNTPQPSTSGQALNRLDSWTNLRDPEALAVSRQDTLEVNPVCVDPRTMIQQGIVKVENGQLKWPSQGEW